MGKTYAAYLNRFFEMADTEPFQMSDIALYITLVRHASRQGWPDEFQVSTEAMLSSIPGMARQTMINARQRLTERGLITYKAGERRSKSPSYRLLTKSESLPPLLDQKAGDNTLIKNKKIDNYPPPPPHAREAEQKFFSEMASDQIFQEQLAMTLGFAKARMTIAEIPELLDRFRTQCEMDQETHEDLRKAKRHFRDWLRKEVQWRLKTKSETKTNPQHNNTTNNPNTNNSNANNKNQRNAYGAGPAGRPDTGSGRHGLNE